MIEVESLLRHFFWPRKIEPGAGYGRDWKSGPTAVSSTPVFASPLPGRPAPHPPPLESSVHVHA